MKVIVTGSRDYSDQARVWKELDDAGCTHLVVGDCPTGADDHAQRWAVRRGVDCAVFTAEWNKEGRSAGPKRNERMVSRNRDAGLCLAFFQPGAANRGTADCARRAERAGITVRRIQDTESLTSTDLTP